MKKLILPFVLSAFAASVSASIIVVDNNAGSPAKYSNLQNAVDSAASGDTVYLQPSGTAYGNLLLNKKIFLIGGGAAPRRQNITPTSMGSISLYNGASNSILMGLRIDGQLYCIDDSLNNLLIANCYFGGQLEVGTECSNWMIEGCIMLGSGGGSLRITKTAPNLLVQNCIFSYSSISINWYTPGSLIFRNNLFLFNGSEDVSNANSYWPTTVVLENNIYFGCKIHGFGGGQWLNNCFYLTSGITISNTGSNSGNFTGNPLFVSFPSSASNWTSFYHDFNLQSGSPCIGTGTNGTDVGLYGGSSRFNPGLQPPIPQVMSINLTNSAVPSGGKLQFKATLKQQN